MEAEDTIGAWWAENVVATGDPRLFVTTRELQDSYREYCGGGGTLSPNKLFDWLRDQGWTRSYPGRPAGAAVDYGEESRVLP